MHVMVSGGSRSWAIGNEVCVCAHICVCVGGGSRPNAYSDIFFIHAHKKLEPEAQQAPRPQWSVRVKQSTAFVLHSKSSGIILPLKYSVSQALLLWSPAISQTAEA